MSGRVELQNLHPMSIRSKLKEDTPVQYKILVHNSHMSVDCTHILVKTYVYFVTCLFVWRRRKKLVYGDRITNIMYAKMSKSLHDWCFSLFCCGLDWNPSFTSWCLFCTSFHDKWCHLIRCSVTYPKRLERWNVEPKNQNAVSQLWMLPGVHR